MSIDANCKSTVITLRKPEEVWKTLKETFRAVSEAAVDAKVSQLQKLWMIESGPVIQYYNRIHNLVNELSEVGQKVTTLEKEQGILRGLQSKFYVTAPVIKTTGRDFNEVRWPQDKGTDPRKVTGSATDAVKKRHCSRECWNNPEVRNYKRNTQNKKAKWKRRE